MALKIARKLFSPQLPLHREMELLASIRMLESRVADLAQQLAERQARIETMQAELAEAWRVAAVNERLTQSVKKSLTWKLTAPLRECRRGATRSLRLLSGSDRVATTPQPRPTLRERLRMLERRVRRFRKSRSAPRRASLDGGSGGTLVLTGRAQEIHEDLCRATRARRPA